MGSRDQHIASYKKNKKLSSSNEITKSENLDWRIIMIYYSALHLLDSTYCNDEVNPHPGNHKKRKRKIYERYSDRIFKTYKNLEGLSRQARYDCIIMKEKHLNKALRYLNEIENAVCLVN